MEAKQRKEISETDKAWLAGFVDGEGSIMLMYLKENKKRGSVKGCWNIKLSIANTKLPVLEFIASLYEGSITKGKNWRPNQNDHYMFVAYSNKAKIILKDIKPYLKLKKRHAEIVEEYCSTIGTTGPGRKGTSVEVFNQRLKLALELKALNKRGLVVKKHKWEENLCLVA